MKIRKDKRFGAISFRYAKHKHSVKLSYAYDLKLFSLDLYSNLHYCKSSTISHSVQPAAKYLYYNIKV